MAGKTVKVLFLGSNPAQTQPLTLDKEIRAISRMIRASEYRDVLELSSRWAVEPDDLLQALNEEKPVVVHFSGHGTSSGEILLADARGRPKAVSAQALRTLFTTLKDNIRLVLLNACYSKTQAGAIAEVVDCVIGMGAEISDTAALAYAASFYRAIGFGRSIREAHDQGKCSLLLEGVPEESTPDLIERSGIDARSVVLVDTAIGEINLSGRRNSTPLDAARVIDVQTEFFNRLTEVLWNWRYMAMQVAFYGGQDDREKLASVAQGYDEAVWSAFSEIRTEISRAQRYVSNDTYLQLRALYAFFVEVDKALSRLVVPPELGSDRSSHQQWSEDFSLLVNFIYSEVTNRIEAVVASVSAELRLGFGD